MDTANGTASFWTLKNSFISREAESEALPALAEERLPRPHWSAHDEVIRCYGRAWELAFKNLRRPEEGSGFIANYIDTAYNDCLFLWDSCFILLFGNYGRRVFDFQRTLDNLYAKQHADGFICREINVHTGEGVWQPHDPRSTGPNILAWQEWTYFLNFGDHDRLRAVFPALMGYHLWTRKHRTWQDGTYWNSGFGCGMDNQPRTDEQGFDPTYDHGHLSWLDATAQALLSCVYLGRIAEAIGELGVIDNLRGEADHLRGLLRNRFWDPESAFYYDCDRNGRRTGVKSIGAYWMLHNDALTGPDLDRFAAHLLSPDEFFTDHPLAALSKDHPDFDPLGCYWRGGVWCPTNYMVLTGLQRCGKSEEAFTIAQRHVAAVTSIFERTETLWEMYAPDASGPGNNTRGETCKSDFVGWSGLAPISILFEHVFGIEPRAHENLIIWHIHLCDEFGVENYPFGPDNTLQLQCAARSGEDAPPSVTIRAERDTAVELRWKGGARRILVKGEAAAWR